LTLLAPAVAVGLLGAVVVHRLFSAQERADREARFTEFVDFEAATIERNLATSLESLFALRAFFHGSVSVTDEEFRSFAQELRERHEIVQALEWIPAVADSDVVEHVATARAGGLADYQIWEVGRDGSPRQVSGRSTYFPVRYVDPLDGQGAALGFDLASEESRRATLQLAVSRDGPAISPPVELVQGGQGTFSFLIALPMARHAAEAIPDYLRGSFLLAVISARPDQVLSDVSERSYFSRVDIHSVFGEELYSLLQWSGIADPEQSAGDLQMSRRFEVAGQELVIAFWPSARVVAQSSTVLPEVAACGAVALWSLFVAFGLSRARDVQRRELRRHQNTLESVLASLAEGVVVASEGGELLLVNESARKLVGEIDERLPVEKWAMGVGAYHPDAVTMFDSSDLPLVRAMRGEAVPETEIFVRNRAMPKGAWLTVTGNPLVGREKEVRGGVIVIRDHTANKEAQARLDRLSQAVEASMDAVFITDVRGTIEYVNNAFEMMTGYSREVALGATPRILNSGQHGSEVFANLWSSLLSGQTYRHMVVNRHCSGALFTADETIVPTRDATGAVSHFVAVMRDMTVALKQREQEVELRLASDVQMRLYPQKPMIIDGWDLAGVVIPAEQTCGDYYDFFEIAEGQIAMAVGDVCGHGLGPALVMSEVRALLRSTASAGSGPAEMLNLANRALEKDLDSSSFVTLLLATLDPERGRIEWANAGHPAGMVVTADGRLKVELSSQTLPLGILPDLGLDGVCSAHLDPGDVMLLITDGVTEYGEEFGEMFGVERVLEALIEVRDGSAEDITAHLVERVRRFCPHRQTDDLTLLVLKAERKTLAPAS
jgi:sigma-B regulation protein RsbU (phosphoserine phosphatase)